MLHVRYYVIPPGFRRRFAGGLFCYKHFTPAGVWISLIQDGEIILELIVNVTPKPEFVQR
jgi:hypothetical protein